MYFIGDEEIEALKRLFDRKKLFRYQSGAASECDLFESEFSNYIGSQRSLLLSSGTNALVLALRAAGIQPNDEVLIPTYTFVATAAAVVQVGATPILVNVDTRLGLCCHDAQKKITAKTKAIIPVHMDGLAADMDGILNLAQKNDLAVIEDVAQAMGGSYKNKKLGTLGLFGCYSLNENKNISCGEGGILTTNDLSRYDLAFALHDTPVQFSPTRKNLFKDLAPAVGYSMRASEIQGALMRIQLTRLENILTELRKRKNIFKLGLGSVQNVELIEGHCAEGDCGSSFHLQFADLAQAIEISKKLRHENLLFFPVTARPAHASWMWADILPKKEERIYERSRFLDSVDILSRTYKMDISLDWSYEKTHAMAQTLKALLNI